MNKRLNFLSESQQWLLRKSLALYMRMLKDYLADVRTLNSDSESTMNIRLMLVEAKLLYDELFDENTTELQGHA